MRSIRSHRNAEGLQEQYNSILCFEFPLNKLQFSREEFDSMQPGFLASGKSFQYKTEIPLALSRLEKCSNLDEVRQVHASMLKTGLVLDPICVSRLLVASMSPISSDFAYARTLFGRITSPNTFMWNAMIRGFSRGNEPDGALILYIQMLSDSVPHNLYTFPFLLKACSDPSYAEEVLQLHSHIIKFGFGTDIFTLNSLIHAYAVCGRMELASLVFDRAPCRDTVSWNSIIDAYIRSGDLETASQMFRDMPDKNVVSWTTMISGLVSAGLDTEALELFHEMQIEGIMPDAVALASTLSACSSLGSLEQGRYIHLYIERNDIKLDPMLECGIIDMYAKSGDIEEALKFFEKSKRKCVSIWNAIISGLAIHGRAREALCWYSEMQNRGIKPNSITFTAILSACSYAGLVEEGRIQFASIKSVFGLSPSMEHYGCLVDLLGQAGLLEEAKNVINTMPMEPNGIVLGALLKACQVHGNLELGKVIGQKLVEIDPSHGGRYVHAARIFGAAREWENAARLRARMKDKGIEKLPGSSNITVGGIIHEFYAGDNVHPCIENIHRMWDQVSQRLKQEGYRTEIGSLVLDLENDEKEMVMSRHSEKLAIAFGLLSTERKVTLRIFKNLQVCEDCHTATKMVSRIYGREIIMRDKTRFHKFREGICSCGDYW